MDVTYEKKSQRLQAIEKAIDHMGVRVQQAAATEELDVDAFFITMNSRECYQVFRDRVAETDGVFRRYVVTVLVSVG